MQQFDFGCKKVLKNIIANVLYGNRKYIFIILLVFFGKPWALASLSKWHLEQIFLLNRYCDISLHGDNLLLYCIIN